MDTRVVAARIFGTIATRSAAVTAVAEAAAAACSTLGAHKSGGETPVTTPTPFISTQRLRYGTRSEQ